MQRISLLLLLFIGTVVSAQEVAGPDQLFGRLFHEVQMQRIFPDGKTFADCIPKRSVQDIMYDYGLQQPSGNDLKAFVLQNFHLPTAPVIPPLATTDSKDANHHLNALWDILTRQPDEPTPIGSLLPLPNAYIVPGGRFREIYYWDSYFTMLGLKTSGRKDLIESMVKNFAYLIDTYGHIPNGNRSYYLSRSQPPFFVLMVKLLADINGPDAYKQFLPQLEKEYLYWMEGDKSVKPGQAVHRFVRMPGGEYLNRYFDEATTPRPESYREDVETATHAASQKMMTMRFASEAAAEKFRSNMAEQVYAHLRAGAASGWDFSSRWFADGKELYTIETTNIVPVDLNCLLYAYENTLAGIHRQLGKKEKAAAYTKWAADRRKAIDKYCYNAKSGFYYDFNWATNRQQKSITAAGLFPFFLFDASSMKAKAALASTVISKHLLASGGLLTTPVSSGQQWDAPNGWAPLQWVAVSGMRRCGQKAIADTIAARWIRQCEAVYHRTGKFMEKYNVVNIDLEAGGGEYPGQDGFGWTNGVYLALKAGQF